MQRPGWLWTALPPDCRRVVCLNDAGLAEALREIGFEVTSSDAALGGDVQQDVVLLNEREPQAAVKAARGAAVAASGVAIVAVGPDASPSLKPVSRPARALQMIASPMTAALTRSAARRLERAMAHEGLEVCRLVTGDRSLPRYGLGPGGWVNRRRLPGGAVVIGSTGPRPLSILEEVVSEAARKLERPLRRRSADVFPSGKVAVELSGPVGESYFLSVTAGDEGGLDRSEAAIRAVTESGSPQILRSRVVEPLATGRVKPVRYVLEPKASGRHPVWMTGRLWAQCVEFLVELHRLPRLPGVSLPSAWPDLPTAVEIIGRGAEDEDRHRLQLVGHAIEDRVSGLEAGGGHGDFFTKNLLVASGDLHTVLDWEWASRDSLPLLDLLDLRGQLGWRRRRGLRVGENFTDILWPLARQGGDAPVRAYCDAVGIPAEASVLEGLTMAHWLLRTARLGSINTRRLEDAGWRHANVAAPVTKILAEAL